jgi:predicted ATPase
MLNILAISNYRSPRDIVVPLKKLNLITGANGTGKSSMYRALKLLADTAQGRVVPSLAREGGLTSTLWAGRRALRRLCGAESMPWREQFASSESTCGSALREASTGI